MINSTVTWVVIYNYYNCFFNLNIGLLRKLIFLINLGLCMMTNLTKKREKEPKIDLKSEF